MATGTDIQTIQWQAWQRACEALGASVSDEQLVLFRQFHHTLIDVNRSVNLTRITAPEDFLYRHLLDSLSVSLLIPADSTVADIGSGAGFPAIPLAILRPDLRLTAVESVGKKCQFIGKIQQELNLANLQVLQIRSEELGRQPDQRESFDAVTARAVAALPVLLEICTPLLKRGGTFLAMKGLSYEEELAASRKAMRILGMELGQIHEFPDPHLAASRVLAFVKTRPTPADYPRQPGLAAKKPL